MAKVKVQVLRTFRGAPGEGLVSPTDSPAELEEARVRQLENTGVPYVRRVGEEPGPSETKPEGPSETKEEPTKEELYERAQELDISDRSKMGKDELAQAIADAEE